MKRTVPFVLSAAILGIAAIALWTCLRAPGPGSFGTEEPVVVASTSPELGRLLGEGHPVRVQQMSGPESGASVLGHTDAHPRKLNTFEQDTARRSIDNQAGQSYSVYQDLLSKEQTTEVMARLPGQWVQVLASREAKRVFDAGQAFVLPADQMLMSNDAWYYYNVPVQTGPRDLRFVVCAIDLSVCPELGRAMADQNAAETARENEKVDAWNQLSQAERKSRIEEHGRLAQELQSVSQRLVERYDLEQIQRAELEREMRADPRKALASDFRQARGMSKEFQALAQRQNELRALLARDPSSFDTTTLAATHRK